MYVTRHSNIIDRAVLDDLWELYEAAYEPLAAVDVTREILFRSEFDENLADPSNRVWVVREENKPVAMSLIATGANAHAWLLPAVRSGTKVFAWPSVPMCRSSRFGHWMV